MNFDQKSPQISVNEQEYKTSTLPRILLQTEKNVETDD